MRSTKPRVGALITVGGARTENWLSLSQTCMKLTFPMGIDVIDQNKYFGAMNIEHVLGRRDVMERMKTLGSHIVEVLERRDRRRTYPLPRR